MDRALVGSAYPVGGLTLWASGVRRGSWCSTWIPARALAMASRRAAPTTVISAAGAIIRCTGMARPFSGRSKRTARRHRKARGGHAHGPDCRARWRQRTAAQAPGESARQAAEHSATGRWRACGEGELSNLVLAWEVATKPGRDAV